MRFRAHIDGVSFAAPGVEGISQLSARWEDAWTAEPWQPLPSGLSPRQAKRLSPAIRLALLLAEGIAEVVPADAAWVFASSVGEGETLDVILRALCEPDMMIQPVRFQNAVHNAASGQWSILRTVTGPVTSIAGYDQTVGAGLLKALMQMDREAVPIGLIAYDAPIPVPLDEKRPLGVPMGFGLALSPQAGPATHATLTGEVVRAEASRPASRLGQGLFATGNPIAAGVVLLEALTGALTGAGGDVFVGLHGGMALKLTVSHDR